MNSKSQGIYLESDNRRLNETLKSTQADRDRLNGEIDKLRQDKHEADRRLERIEKTKQVENNIVILLAKAEELVRSVQDPALRQTAYAFALNEIKHIESGPFVSPYMFPYMLMR
jgi:16S rRNA U516 pseudouridylate synthase RsuA-like enzyme